MCATLLSHECEQAWKGDIRDIRHLHIDIFCTNGVHRSVALSVILQHLLCGIEHHKVSVTHLDQDNWPCRVGDTHCRECSQLDGLETEYSQLEGLWEHVKTGPPLW